MLRANPSLQKVRSALLGGAPACAYHIRTQLADGRPPFIIDLGSVGKFLRRQVGNDCGTGVRSQRQEADV